MIEINGSWKRDFDVYSRIEKLGIDLGDKEEIVPPAKGKGICKLTFTPSGLIFFSGVGAGTGAASDDDESVSQANAAGRQAGIAHLRVLHWALHPDGSLNDVWYCVKCLGMVNSPGGGPFTRSPSVVNGYSKVFHDVFGGPLSEFADDGLDQSMSGWHARSAVAGFDLPGGCSIEPEMIIQLDPDLALKIIRARGPHA